MQDISLPNHSGLCTVSNMDESVLAEAILTHRPVAPLGFTVKGTTGAEVLFIGRTRSEQHLTHGTLQHLAYEAHQHLARNTIEILLKEAIERWPLHAARIQHATGIVRPGEASVCIELLAAHRTEGFEACRWLIDTLKKRVPIWKKEVWSDGTTWAEGIPIQADR